MKGIISVFIFICILSTPNIFLFWLFGWETTVTIMALIGFNNWFVKKIVEWGTGKTICEVKMEAKNK